MLKTNCHKCGNLLRQAANFCSICGTSVGSTGPSTDSFAVELSHTPNFFVWNEFKTILFLYASFLSIIFVSGIASWFTSNPIRTVVTWIVLTGVTVFFAAGAKDSVLNMFSLKMLKPRLVLSIIFVAIVCFWFLNFYFSLFDLIQMGKLRVTSNFFKHGWPVWSVYFFSALMPGLIEEIAFRGIIYSKLKEIFSTKEALFIQAACFSVLHLVPVIFISHLVMGLFLGWVRERTNSLVLSVAFHISWNALVIYNEIYS